MPWAVASLGGFFMGDADYFADGSSLRQAIRKVGEKK